MFDFIVFHYRPAPTTHRHHQEAFAKFDAFKPKNKIIPTGLEDAIKLIDSQLLEKDAMKFMKCTHSSPQSLPVTASRLHFVHRDEQQKPSSAKFL